MVSQDQRETVEETLELLEEAGWNVKDYHVNNADGTLKMPDGEVDAIGTRLDLTLSRYN